MPQDSAKWRLLWRLAPRLLERWSTAGRLDAIHGAVTGIVNSVCDPREPIRHARSCCCLPPPGRAIARLLVICL